jgi:hypothetical protein
MCVAVNAINKSYENSKRIFLLLDAPVSVEYAPETRVAKTQIALWDASVSVK